MVAMHALPAELTICAATALRAEFQQWLTKPAKGKRSKQTDAALKVDASGVLEVDGAGAQLLMALSQSLVASGRQLRLVKPSHTLVAACQTLGMSMLLVEEQLGDQP